MDFKWCYNSCQLLQPYFRATTYSASANLIWDVRASGSQRKCSFIAVTCCCCRSWKKLLASCLNSLSPFGESVSLLQLLLPFARELSLQIRSKLFNQMVNDAEGDAHSYSGKCLAHPAFLCRVIRVGQGTGREASK